MALLGKKNEKAEEAEMGFLDHLEELRWHVVRALIAILSSAIVIFFLKDLVFDKIIFGPTRPDFITYKMFCDMSEAICFGPQNLRIITKELGEQFLSHIKVSFWLGLVVAFPLVFREFWRFVKPGLYNKEKKVTRGVVFVCSLLFLMGVLFGYFVIAPFAVSFLSQYAVSADVENTLTLNSLVSYMTMFTIPTGLVFELPIVVFFLAKLGVIYPSTMRSYRKHAVIAILALAALITPPDVVTQFLIGLPLYVLYEISIIVCRRVNPDPTPEKE